MRNRKKIIEIPKPAKPLKSSTDSRVEYLEEWKKLFKDIDPKIKVHLHSEKDFREIFESVTDRTEFANGFDCDEAKILIIIPRYFKTQFGEIDYLVGLAHNQMFSGLDVNCDTVYQNEEVEDCLPKTITWEQYYKKIYKMSENLKKEIPKPPKPA